MLDKSNFLMRIIIFKGKIINIMKNLDRYHYILSKSAAPTLKYLKPASLVCLPKSLRIDDIRLKAEGLELTLLYKCSQNEAVLIFNRQMLQKIIDDGEVKAFLAEYSYPVEQSLDLNIEHLKRRLQGFFEGNGFAHEVGLFLGYPLEDVRDFIKNDKRHYFCGYWKVFNNPTRAQKIMDLYDIAKSNVIYEHNQGKRYFEFTGN
jgi:hypothetical protein